MATAEVPTDRTLVQAPLDSRALPGAHVHPGSSALLAGLHGRDDDLRFMEEIVVRVRAGDRLLACTGGLYTALSHERITRILAHRPAPADAVSALVHAVTAVPGRDDATAAVADVVVVPAGRSDPVRRVGAAVRLGAMRRS